MAGIAHPYEETYEEAAADATAPHAKRRERVSFTDLVDTWARRETEPEVEALYQERRGAFEAARGEITDAYLCETGPMAIVLTAHPPSRFEKLFLFRKERIQIYTETERLVRAHPEVAHALHRAEVQYVSVRQALRGLSQRLLVN